MDDDVDAAVGLDRRGQAADREVPRVAVAPVVLQLRRDVLEPIELGVERVDLRERHLLAPREGKRGVELAALEHHLEDAQRGRPRGDRDLRAGQDERLGDREAEAAVVGDTRDEGVLPREIDCEHAPVIPRKTCGRNTPVLGFPAVKDRLLRGAARAALADPIARVLGRRRRRGVDRELDPQIAAALELQRLLGLPALDSMEPEPARRFAEDGMSPLDLDLAPMAEIIDTAVEGHRGPIPVRIFVPRDAGPHWIVYLHGGGGVIGSIRSSEPVARRIAAQTGCTLASVGYRLGPEHRHPAAVDDACAAWNALAARAGRSAPDRGRRRQLRRLPVGARRARRDPQPRPPGADLSDRRHDADLAVARAQRRRLPADPVDGPLVPRPLPAPRRRPPRGLADLLARSARRGDRPRGDRRLRPARRRGRRRTRRACATPGSPCAIATTRRSSTASSASPARCAPPARRSTSCARTSASCSGLERPLVSCARA